MENRSLASMFKLMIPDQCFVVRDYSIPPLSKTLYPSQYGDVAVVGPKSDLAERYSLIMANSIVDFTNNGIGKIRVLSPKKNEVHLRKGTVIALAESCLEGVKIVDAEDEDEIHNLDSMRIKLGNAESSELTKDRIE